MGLKWQIVYDFIYKITLYISKGNHSLERIQQLELKFKLLNNPYQQLHIKNKRRSNPSIRSLPSNIIEYLYQLLDTESKLNPFRDINTKWRVFTAFILLLHQGIRRGELLKLAVNAINNSFNSIFDISRSYGIDRFDASTMTTVLTGTGTTPSLSLHFLKFMAKLSKINYYL